MTCKRGALFLLASCTTLMAVSGCGSSPPQVTQQSDGGTVYFGFDAGIPDAATDEELFAGFVDRSTEPSAWNGLLVPKSSAHALITVVRTSNEIQTRLRASESTHRVYEGEFPFDGLPFTFEILGNREALLAGGSDFLVYISIFNHRDNTFLAGDLLNEAPLKVHGLRRDLRVFVTGLEPCLGTKGGICADEVPDGGISNIELGAMVEDPLDAAAQAATTTQSPAPIQAEAAAEAQTDADAQN